MIIQIKEYSFRTGKGIAVDSDGKKIDFTYKDFNGKKAIPVGKKANFKHDGLEEATLIWIVIFNLVRFLKLIGGKLWR